MDLQCGKAAGTDFTVDGLMKKDGGGYKAVYLAIGLQGGRRCPSPATTPRASSTPSTCSTTPPWQKVDMGKNVVVIGGGDVAFDAGRTALRLGAEKVTLTCIEDDETMPASADEIEEGLGESISFICSCMPTAIVPGADGRPARSSSPPARWATPTSAAGARRWPSTAPSRAGLRHGHLRHRPEHGQRLPAGCRRRRGEQRNQIVTDQETLRTGARACSPAATPRPAAAWTAIEAVAAGRRAARSIHNYLRGEQLLQVEDEVSTRPSRSPRCSSQTAVMARMPMPHLPGAARKVAWARPSRGSFY